MHIKINGIYTANYQMFTKETKNTMLWKEFLDDGISEYESFFTKLFLYFKQYFDEFFLLYTFVNNINNTYE